MDFKKAVFLGLIQGLTEFLPVSSSGHLVIGQKLLGFESAPVLFDVFVHLGTLLAIFLFFKARVFKFFAKLDNLKKIIIANLPAGLIGLILNSYAEKIFTSLFLVGFNLLFTAGLLLKTKSNRSGQRRLDLKTSFIIGLFQALAILPGISRSGATISAGLYQQVNKAKLFEFSFFLSVPAILAASGLQLLSVNRLNVNWPAVFIGFISAFFSGYASLFGLRKLIKTSRFYLFGYYCLSLGAGLLLSLLLS